MTSRTARLLRFVFFLFMELPRFCGWLSAWVSSGFGGGNGVFRSG
jgi:hypothetical protein